MERKGIQSKGVRNKSIAACGKCAAAIAARKLEYRMLAVRGVEMGKRYRRTQERI
jgi:hypothetical protein